MAKIKEHTYFVKGMHCASCEILIEQKLLSIKGIKSVDASTAKARVLVEYAGKKPEIEQLNNLFKREGYSFSEKSEETKEGMENSSIFSSIFFALLIIWGFWLINKLGITSWINVSSKSSLPAFFIFGLLAGVSTCAALVGGLILSMSKQWLTLYADEKSTMKKLQPHIMFNTGRILSYLFFGAVLGFLGTRFQISLKFTSFLIIIISVMMFFVALQMLGIKFFRRMQFTLPKSTTRYIANEKNFKGKYMPLLMGALTFFLPCGFTITSQGLALLSGNPIQGALIMGSFALGTVGPLLGIGLSSVKLSQKPHLAYKFSKIAGILILFFALFNINSQLNILGFSSLSDLGQKTNQTSKVDEKGLPPIVDGKQVMKMNASSSGYNPNYFKVRVGVPVKWEITDTGTSGCTNAIISKGLFNDSINLTPGQVSVKEFTPEKTGKYKFSCWMGMITGVIEVVDTSGSANSIANNSNNTNSTNDINTVIPSGASGCGCGGGGGSGSCGAH